MCFGIGGVIGVIRLIDLDVETTIHPVHKDRVVKKITHTPTGKSKVAFGNMNEVDKELADWMDDLTKELK